MTRQTRHREKRAKARHAAARTEQAKGEKSGSGNLPEAVKGKAAKLPGNQTKEP